MADVPSWQERVGGRWAVSWQAYGIGLALNAPLLVFTGGSIGAEPVRAGDMPGWTVVAIVAAAATAGWVLLGDRVFFPRRQTAPVPVPAVVAYHAGTGLIFASAIWFVGPAVGVGRVGTFSETAVTTMAIGLWFGLTMILLLDARDRFRTRREQLLDEAVTVELTLLEEEGARDRVQDMVRERVGAVTEDLRADVEATLAARPPLGDAARTTEPWRDIAERMRESAESSLRPLSHELWRSAAEEFPKPHWTQVLRQSVVSENFWIGPSLVIVLIGYLRAGTFALGLLPGLVAVGVLVSGVGLVLVAANAIIARAPRLRVAAVLAGFILAQVLGMAYTQVLASIDGSGATAAELLGSVIGMTISLLAPSTIASLNSSREEVLERLQTTTDQDRARQIAQARRLSEITQQAARIIHGSLQTKLIAAAAAIDQAATTGREDLLTDALRHVSVLLESPEPEASIAESLSDLVSGACGAWHGILDVSIDMDPGAARVTGTAAEAVSLIVEEALANAYRHGDAEHAQVTIIEVVEDGTESVQVTVKDDGSAPPGGASGLGTLLIQRLASGHASFESLPDGYLVMARVRLDDQV